MLRVVAICAVALGCHLIAAADSGSCYVPEIEDGELGRNQRKNRYRQEFISLQVGESVKHLEIVTIRCKDGYSSGNRTSSSSQEVECNDGAWSEPLHCYSILCTGEPPPVENGSPIIQSRMHGSTIWYKCYPGYGKTKTGMVSCQYGKWEGTTPVCSDSKCQMKELNYPGLVKPQMDFINHREWFALVCRKDYKAVSSRKHVTCFKGKWDITINPCVIDHVTCDLFAASPKLNILYTDGGRVGSVASFQCLSLTSLVENSHARCRSNGTWSHSLPTCAGIPVCRVNKDKASHLIVEPMKDYYRFGEILLLSCPPGQKLTSEVERMMCLGRTWSNTVPDCAEMTESNLSGFTQTTD